MEPSLNRAAIHRVCPFIINFTVKYVGLILPRGLNKLMIECILLVGVLRGTFGFPQKAVCFVGELFLLQSKDVMFFQILQLHCKRNIFYI